MHVTQLEDGTLKTSEAEVKLQEGDPGDTQRLDMPPGRCGKGLQKFGIHLLYLLYISL